MKNRFWMQWISAGLLVVVVLAGCVPAMNRPERQETSQGTLPLQDCRLGTEGFAVEYPAKCGTLEVFENRAAQSGRKISLRIAVVPSSSQNRQPDPLFLLAGGPGQAASEAFVPLLGALSRVNFERDLVLVDQRGTGQSNVLRCPLPPDTPDLLPGEDVALEDSIKEAETCLSTLSGDTRFYTTEIAMQDLNEVRAALGYEQVNLLGVSYGTRTALAYLKMYPQHVRTVTLDSVVPPGWALGAFTAEDAQKAFDRMVARCLADAACQTAFPDIAGTFDRLVQSLEAQPVEVSLPDPRTGEETTVKLTRDTFVSNVRLILYNTEMVALLPLIIYNAAQGDWQLAAAHYLMLNQSFTSAIADGMYLSVLCAEDVQLYPQEQPQRNNFSFALENMRAICAAWPHGEQPAALREPVQSDVPVLLLSGSADPVTPPENAEEVAASLPNSLHLVVEDMGHSIVGRSCTSRLVEEFIENASVQGLDTECVQKIAPLPFFTTLAGPQP